MPYPIEVFYVCKRVQAVFERPSRGWSGVFGSRVQMHEKAQETEECEEVFQAAAKKFRHSKKVNYACTDSTPL